MVKMMRTAAFSLTTSAVLSSKISGPRASQEQSYAEDGNGRYYLEQPNFSYWMDTKDDILSEFKNYMQRAEQRLGATYADTEQAKSLKTLQRFAELVDMIMYLQKVPFFGQYWYYGCWCAPEGFFNKEKQGYGKPVDLIDRSCRSMSYCYECAQLDHGNECNTQEVNYRWHGSIDENGKKQVFCDDEPGTCEHSLCSCDKNLAEELALFEDKWNLHHHHKWGEFNRDSCFISDEQLQVNENVVGELQQGNTQVMTKEQAQAAAIAAAQKGEWKGDFGSDGLPIIEGLQMRTGGADNAFSGLPAITLKFASAFANPEEKYCCGEYGNRENKRVPLRRFNNHGEPHNEQCCIGNNSSGGHPYSVKSHCCNAESGAVGVLGEDSCN
jgi:hypothetical protein